MLTGNRVVVTGIGMVTCLGHNQAEVVENLILSRHGIRKWQPLQDGGYPIHVAAPLPGFNTDSVDPEDWAWPSELTLRLEQLRSLPPHGLYAMHAMQSAIADAGLSAEEISNPRTGLFTASAGSVRQTHHHVDRIKKAGPLRSSPLSIVSSIAGTLSFNLSATYHIQGSSSGFVSACASSGHALGYAFEEISTGRQDRMIVVGAEDFTLESILPFASMRALSLSTDPDTASRPFDRDRDGFVATGGAVVLILEDEAVAKARNASVYGQVAGWGQSTDGYHVAASHPEGAGLLRAMQNALARAGCLPPDIDYINAHATSTPLGDEAECHALKALLGKVGRARISSTKALTGHSLSLSSVMETAFCLLAFKHGFIPGSAHIQNLDPVASGLNILRETVHEQPSTILTNSSGFGGANVAVVLRAV